MDLKKINTELVRKDTVNFSEETTQEMLNHFINEFDIMKKSLENAKGSITNLIEAAIKVALNNGKIVYVGAGTSGRLGVLDASEIPPTFNDSETFIGLIAGGDHALRNPIENAEDNTKLAQSDLEKINFNSNDMLIGVAASGRTPYVLGAIEYAKSIGAVTGSITNTSENAITNIVDFPVEAVVNGEIITGSTRLSSGTIQKTILNALSTITMTKKGKVYKNYMIDLKPSNAKLDVRSSNIIKEITNKPDEVIAETLKTTNNNVGCAIIMLLKEITYAEAKELLKENTLQNIISG